MKSYLMFRRINNPKYRRKVIRWISERMLSAEDRKRLGRVYRLAEELTFLTGVKHDVDHVWPINHPRFTGLYVPWNLQVIPQSINNMKSNIPPEEWEKRVMALGRITQSEMADQLARPSRSFCKVCRIHDCEFHKTGSAAAIRVEKMEKK